ncbi:MAG: hypothetical protein AAF564_24870, partial [Bacteroidota bacterium]
MKTLPMRILIFVFSLTLAGAAVTTPANSATAELVTAEFVAAALAPNASVLTVVQEAAGDTGQSVLDASQDAASSSFSMSNLWSLTEKAGPLRWPIFIVFVIGVFLVCFK